MKLPAEFGGIGFSPHPSKPSVLPPSPKGRLSIRFIPPQRRRGTIEDGGVGIRPDRLRWIRKIHVGRGLRPERSEEVLLGYSRRYFCFFCTPISLTAQRNGGTRQRNAFQPLQFAPANAVPFIRGLKRSTGRTAVSIPDHHRSGRRRFSFCICRPVIYGWIWRGGITIPPSATQTSPLTGESPLGRLIRSAEGGGRIPPVLTKGQNHPPLTRGAIASVEGGGGIPPFDKRGFFGLFFTKKGRKVYELWSVEI